jgi:hypothetical protein
MRKPKLGDRLAEFGGPDVNALRRSRDPIQVTVSGSFRRHLHAVQDAVLAFEEAGARVLSPADPRIVDSFGEFVFVSSDLRRSIKGVQNRHLEAIAHSDFLWLTCPDGYVGPSASMELGYAVASGIPIFADCAPTDWTLRQYVRPVGTPVAALHEARPSEPQPAVRALLVEPSGTLAAIEQDVDLVRAHLLNDRRPHQDEPLEAPIRRLRSALALPTTRR